MMVKLLKELYYSTSKNKRFATKLKEHSKTPI